MHTSSRITTFLLSLFLALLSLTLVCGDDAPFIMCDENGNQGSISYQTYVGMIYGTIYTQAAVYGYGFSRVGEVHGSLLCRGDVQPGDCKNCFIQMGQFLRTRCPAMLMAFGYSDYCILQHTYKKWHGGSTIYYCSAGNIVPNDKAWFTKLLSDVFSHVSLNAATDSKYMSTMYVDLGDSNALYVYGQCQNQITADDCQSCLGYLTDVLVTPGFTCADGFVGGRLVGWSCTIRYELYPFIGV